MKHLVLCGLAAMSALAMDAAVVYNSGDVKVSNLQVAQTPSEVTLSFNIDASGLTLKSNQEAILSPVITDGTNEVVMPSVSVAGRNRYYYDLRNNDGFYSSDVNLFRNKEKAAYIPYAATVKYQPWMDLSTLAIKLSYVGCCGEDLHANYLLPVADLDMRPAEYVSEIVYVAPVAEAVKVRQEKGSAYVDFVVNKSVINPDYRNNAKELAKIAETIEKVKSDKDLTITSISIKGFASPEGPYEHNAKLAQSRTEALMDYVKGLSTFPKSVKFYTSSVPENWEGLIAWLDNNEITDKEALLALCKDEQLTPDQKDARIKRDFPTEYQFLLKNVYPSLRRSDYVVEYTVREYADVAEIIQVLNTQPAKLSLNEIFLAAQTMEPGSKEYNNAFETAVYLYPNDETANLNAANAAIARGDFSSAERYLKRAGNSNEAQYARGVLAASREDYASAASIFRQLASSMPQAASALEQVEMVQSRPSGTVTVSDLTIERDGSLKAGK